MRRPRIFVLMIAAGSLALGSCRTSAPPPPQHPVSPPPAAPVAQEPLVGLAAFTGDMLRRGAGQRTFAELAEAIEFVGGDLSVSTDADSTSLEVRVLKEHLGLAMEILADMVERPTFPADEIERLRRQELDRLALMASQPNWLSRRAFHRFLYGPDHPYGQYDADPAAIQRLRREDLVAFHQRHYVPRNAFLLVVGDTTAPTVQELAAQHFSSWSDLPAPSPDLPAPPVHQGREIWVVNKPGTTQAQIVVGNVALPRADPDYVPLRVANQVLGGNASSRLFMNLRERCSYSYGVYSNVGSRLGPAPLFVAGAVEAQHTGGALREIFHELGRIRDEQVPGAELEAARAFLVGAFPLMTDTAREVAELVAIQNIFGLPRDYWNSYISGIAGVEAATAQEMARKYIEPDRAVVVLVGDASIIAEPARRFGPVTIVTPEGTVVERLSAVAGEAAEVGSGCRDLPPHPERGATAGPPAPTAPRDLAFADVQEQQLPNGLSVLVVPRDQLPLVQLRLVVLSGSAADSRLTHGSPCCSFFRRVGARALTDQHLTREKRLGRPHSPELSVRVLEPPGQSRPKGRSRHTTLSDDR